MTREISNYDDVIDSRDVIERIAELQLKAEDGDALLDQDERIELAALVEFAQQVEQYAEDWLYGATLVRDSYFIEYAEQLAKELDLLPRDAGWPARHIDWEAAADDLQTDYTDVDFDGVTYWVR
jgi:antirestriction protein